jgi:hypothetical protein
MKYLLVIAAIVLSTTSAHADFFYKLVGYECDENANAVILTYDGALNEDGKKMMKNKSPRQWDPWSLIVKDKKNRNYIGSLKTVYGQCKLSDGIYEITIGALPGNGNLQGKCGGFMSAWAEVRRDSEIALPRHAFEYGDCHVAQPITMKIIIEAGSKEPVIKKVSWDDFYKKPPNP